MMRVYNNMGRVDKMKAIETVLALVLFSLIFSSPTLAESRTAVTILVEAGPAFTEDNLEIVNLIVPKRPLQAMPLHTGDKIFFETLESLLEGEGTIINIYDFGDLELDEAIILDHVYQE